MIYCLVGSEQIHIEQKSQDEYVSEYLRLTKSADRTQLNRIKGVFERKNQKSMANITQVGEFSIEHHSVQLIVIATR